MCEPIVLNILIYHIIAAHSLLKRTLVLLCFVFCFFNLSAQDRTIDSLKKILSHSNNKKTKGNTALHLGEVYFNQGNMAEALEYFNRALLISEQINDKKNAAESLNNMGIVFNRNGNLLKCIELMEQSLKLKIEIKDTLGIGKAYNNLGYFYALKGEQKKAYDYYTHALKLQKDNCDSTGQAYTLVNLGKIYRKDGNYKKAKEYFKESLLLRELIDDQQGVAESTLELGLVSFMIKDIKSATIFAQRSFKIAKELNRSILIRNASELLYKIYKFQNNHADALKMHELFTQTKDSISSEKNRKLSLQKELQITFEKKAAADSLKAFEVHKIEELKHEQAISKQRSYIYGGIIAFILMLGVTIISLNAYKQKQKDNKLITLQKHLVEAKQKEIIDSINYAKKIQSTLLANEELVNKHLPSHFVVFKPKDIVSGDFYWATIKNNRFYLGVCDSTGHGVPGAFMSLLNISFLNEAINERGIIHPHKILNYVRERLISNISKDGNQDGMDGVLVCFEIVKDEKTKITYSAANNAPLIVRNNSLQYLGYDKMPVGAGSKTDHFILRTIDYDKGDFLYLFTDGFADQFGGSKGKKFKSKALNQLLLANSGLNMEEQKQNLEAEFDNWKGNLEQVDDVCIIGIQL